MKKMLFLLLALSVFSGLHSQIVKPVKWTQRLEKLSATEFNLVFEAAIEDQWHVYSQFTPDGGPLPLTLDFKNQKGNFELVGKAVETGIKKSYNDIFEVDEWYWEKKVHLVQRIKVTNPKLETIEVKTDYQVCKEVCINDNAKFSFKLPKIPVEEAAAPATVQDKVQDQAPAVSVDSAAIGKDSSKTATVSEEKAAAISEPSEQNQETRGMFSIFFIAFLSGFAALLTPCVFPLIPMTVSFFTKQSKTKAAGIRNAITYGISIIVIYVFLGSLVTGIFGADALNSLSTNVWFNLVFFVLLVFFAISFMGAFEIVLPNSWANKVDRQADRGGIVGILFMALALAIVSFSCTGPIVGTLLFEAASQGGIGPIVGMLGFSLALALPFMLFAMFPGWLNSLPKSGGWLNTVKVFLGFLELALAFKFLSNADLVLQMHLLEREVFLSIWIAIFGTLALYLFGKITTPHDSPLPFISVGRLLLGLLVLTFTVYLIPGLWGAPLKLISAFPPPLEYSESPHGVGNSSADVSVENLPKDAVMSHGFVTFNDYEKALAYSKEVNKPMLLDFTGFACVNCRKMENNVWTDPEVSKILKNDIVLVSLYVDDKRDLPKEEQFVSPSTGEEIETIGDKWTDFIITRYKTNSQPTYVLVGPDGKDITGTISYVGKDEYLEWLRDGLAKFNK